MLLWGCSMIKLSKVSVLVLVALSPLFMSTAMAGFAFSCPFGSVITSPLGFGGGLTTFNTYVQDVIGVSAGAEVACLPFGSPFGFGTNAVESRTFATSFTSAGCPAFPGLITTSMAGGPDQPFSLNFF
jgi:hypothetical protein